MPLYLIGEEIVRAIVFGDHKQTACVFIYSMDDAGSYNAVDA